MRRVFVPLLLGLALAASAAGQSSAPGAKQSSGDKPPSVGEVHVRIRDAGGAPIQIPAQVRLISEDQKVQRTSEAADNSKIVFRDVPLGEYILEVRVPGYLPVTQDASLLTPDGVVYVSAELRTENSPAPVTSSIPALPPMAPKARKELGEAAAALQSRDLKLAQKRLDSAHKLAPEHPDVPYVQGLIFLETQKLPEARSALESAVSLYPQHGGALSALGILLYRLGNYSAAVTSLEKALEGSPQGWQSHRALALCQIKLRAYDLALAHTERALEIAGEDAPDLHVLHARLLFVLQQKDQARAELNDFIAQHPKHADISSATRLLAISQAEEKSFGDAKTELNPGPSAAVLENADLAVTTDRVTAVLLETRTGAGLWAPPPVDVAPPFVLRTTPCMLPDVLDGAGKRVAALAANLEQVAATEKVEQVNLDEEGHPGQARSSVFNYVVMISEPRPGQLMVDVLRQAVRRSSVPLSWTNNGLGAMALIFHPYFVTDFEMRCEGLTQINGQEAWSVYFKQRANVPSRMRSYTTRAGNYDVPLKGRAWIAANNSQVLRLETDLVEPVKGLQLEQEHLVIEYQPVDFKTRQIRLWLPANAEMYVLFRGHRSKYQHRFTEYKMFNVDVSSKTADPKSP